MRISVSALVLLLALTGCGVKKGAPEWIGSDAAVVRCTVPGRNLRLPRLFDMVPTAQPPTGLYTQGMDPVALDHLGFERERVVCATLLAPDDAEIESAAAAIADLRHARDVVVGVARADHGGCTCTLADRLELGELIPGCNEQAATSTCEVDPEGLANLAATLGPLQDRLAVAELPRTHWRVFGRTDRPDRFVEKYGELIGRHPGGSDVFVRGVPLPPRPGMNLVRALLGMDGVVAVVRQDSGRATLVVRVLDDVLVLDHFAHAPPVGLRPRALADLQGLLGHLDDAQIAWFRAMLAPPSSRRELLFDPRKGHFGEFDHAGLERVDRALLVMARLGGNEYDEAAEVRTGPALLVDRLALQVPFGTEGERLLVRMRLAEAGRQWLHAAEGLALTDALGVLEAIEQTPSFVPGTPGGDPELAFDFVLRGQPLEQVLFAGLAAGPKLLAAIESASPGSVRGEADDFEVDLPGGVLPGGFEGRPGTSELRERLSLRRHRLKGELIEGGRVLELELEP